MINFLKENWEVIGGLVGTIIAYFGGKRMGKMNEVEVMQNIYLQFTLDTNGKFEEMRKEMTELKSTLKEYIEQCSKCENNKIH
jgi:hypothetical protein